MSLSAKCNRVLPVALANGCVAKEIITAVNATGTPLSEYARRSLESAFCDKGVAAEFMTAVAATPAGSLGGRARSVLATVCCDYEVAKELALAITGS